MKVTPEISKIIMEDGNALEIAAASEKLGFNNLRRSGLKSHARCYFLTRSQPRDQ